jgi:hypothetical protein
LWLSDDQHKKVVSKIKEYAQPSKEKPKEKGQKNALIEAEILAMVESNLEKSSNFVSGLTNIVMNPESPRVEIPIPKPARGLEKQVKSDPDTPLTQKEKNKELQKSFSGEQSAHRAFKKHIRQEITEVVDTSTPKKSREKLKKTVERSGSDTKNFKPVIGNPIIRNLELAEMAKIPSKDDQVESSPVPEVKPLGKRKARKEKAEAVNKSKETRKQLDELKRRQVEESSINTEILEGMGNFPDEAPAGDKDNQIQL